MSFSLASLDILLAKVKSLNEEYFTVTELYTKQFSNNGVFKSSYCLIGPQMEIKST